MKRYLFILVLVIVLSFVTIYIIGYDEEKIKKEVDILLTLTNEEIENKEEVMSGDYLVIEEAIREYIIDFNTINYNIDKSIEKASLDGVLSYENYVIDGPLFTNSNTILDNNLSTLQIEVNKLILMLDTRESDLYLDEDIDNDLYNLYNNLIKDKVIKVSKETYLNDLVIKHNSFINLVNSVKEVLIFLSDNSDNWQLGDDNIEFYSDELYNQYNNLLEGVE